MENNPIIWADFPDPDMIRVGDTYYMISTTMHLMPGGVILQSYDLIHWEIAAYVYDILEDTPGQRLIGDCSIYGQGMWAATLRYHKDVYYVCFVANDTHKTYLYQAADIRGPWKKQYIEGFYHDCSLLFDDDDRIYIVYGNTDIYLTELKQDLSGPKPEGLHRIIVSDKGKVTLGYEGAHIYKINGRYYVFFIHWPANGTRRRVQACFTSESLEGEFSGRDVLDDDMNFYNSGIAQGGIINTPEGEWYAMLFQDHGAVGRIPVLVPIHWDGDFPVFGVDGKVPHQLYIKSTRPDYQYSPIVESDNFHYVSDGKGNIRLKLVWQWNHIPEEDLWTVTEKPGTLRIKSGKVCQSVEQAVNTLTQRMIGPSCDVSVTVDYSGLREGDYAGICALQGCYGFIAVTKEADEYFLVMLAKDAREPSLSGITKDKKTGKEYARVPLVGNKVTLKVSADFTNKIDEVKFYYQTKELWAQLGITHKLYFKLDHFVGCRIGLFLFSTKETGGRADFTNFIYQGIANGSSPNC